MIPIACTPRIDRPHPAVIFCAPRGPSLAAEVAMERWNPKRETTRQEDLLLKRLHRTRKLFGFLRRHRHELFDDKFQTQLESMYRGTGAGKEPVPPALLAMVVLLQSYLGSSDAEAVELAVVDLRWQMVLGCLGATEPPFSQGALQGFRERLIAHDMERDTPSGPALLRRRYCRTQSRVGGPHSSSPASPSTRGGSPKPKNLCAR